MSGIITPILDTLLHEVLGRRVETQVQQELLVPVKPLTPGHAPRAVHSDSRLNAEQAAMQRQGGVDDRSPPVQGTGPSSRAPASTHTHFSAAARSIADILVKFPAPPAVVRAPAPLLQAGETVDPPQLAARLQQSIETTGLFYEAHLARWHRGDISRALLEREPQMQHFLRHGARQGVLMSAPGEAGSHRVKAGERGLGRIQALTAAPPGVSSPSSPIFVHSSQQTTGLAGQVSLYQGPRASPAAEPVAEAARPVVPSGNDPTDDWLPGIIRHQLELLGTPTLRWEGDLWSGVFMALAIHMPEAFERPAERQEHDSQTAERDEAVWHSDMTLRLPNLGTLGVSVSLRGALLDLTLESDNVAGVLALQTASHELEARLNRCGLEKVNVSVLPKRDAPEGHEP